MASSQTSAIVFDLGGVLVELTGVPVLIEWTRNAMTEEELWHRWLTSPCVRAFETGALSSEEFATGIIDELTLPVSVEEFLHEFTYWPSGTFPGVHELLETLPPHVTTASLSNTNAVHWPRLTDEMGLGDAFHHHFASHLTGRIKPDHEAFHHVRDTLDMPAEQIVFVDDNQLNVDAAARVGFKAFLTRGIEEVREVLQANKLLSDHD